MNNAQKIALLLVVVGFAFTGNEFYTFYNEEVPQMEQEVMALQGQVDAQQRELKRLRAFAQNIESVKRELRELNIQLQTALEHMPPTFDLAKLLRRINQIARNSGVRLVNFLPDAQEVRAPGTFYATTTIRFQLQGAFTEALVFFDQLTRLKRIINLREVQMAPQERNGARAVSSVRGDVPLTTSVTIVTYRFAE